MLLTTKCQLFSLFTIDQNKSRKMLSDFTENKETFFFTFKKIAFIFKGVNLCFWAENANIFFI